MRVYILGDFTYDGMYITWAGTDIEAAKDYFSVAHFSGGDVDIWEDGNHIFSDRLSDYEDFLALLEELE